MNKNIIDKLYWFFWASTTILTGILAGFMISHSIMLGRFFTWYVESGNMELLRQTFSVFLESNDFFNSLYDSFLWLAFVSGII